jgi:ribosomal-protein-alanine N-acetyltransferase
MTIRRATSADAEVLTALEAACFAEPWSSRALRNALTDEKYGVLVAQGTDEILGYALGWSVGEEAELARIGVLPAFRGVGWGEKLARALLEEFAARGVKSVFLEVRASNEVALRMYAHCGFKVVGRRREYYADGEEAKIMVFDLR